MTRERGTRGVVARGFMPSCSKGGPSMRLGGVGKEGERDGMEWAGGIVG